MKKKTIWIVLAVIMIVIVAVGAYCGYYYSKYVNINTIYPGVTIQGKNVSGMSVEEAQALIEEYGQAVVEEKVTLQVEGKEKSFAFSKMGMTFDAATAAKQAWNLGREGNILKRIGDIRRMEEKGENVPLTFSIDEEKTRKIFEKKAKKFLEKTKDATITRKDGAFVITPEVNGITMDLDANLEKLLSIVRDPEWDQKAIVFPMEYQVDKAKHTEEELSTIKDQLGTFTTSYYDSSWGRCANVQNGAAKINGTVLFPGDTFSVYEAVAPFNAENGYELAGSYENGKTVQTYGGGICQVSTTLYNAVLRAELEVTERSNHSMTVHYVELSEDAAIAGTEKDLKFKNNLENPVYIEGKTEGRTITFTIYGKEYRDPNRSISFVSETLSSKAPTEKIIKDKTMEEGKKKVEEEGRTGYKARLWKVTYMNGEEVDRQQINSSSYMSTQRVVRVGTKKKEEKKDKKKDGEESTTPDSEEQEKQEESTEQET